MLGYCAASLEVPADVALLVLVLVMNEFTAQGSRLEPMFVCVTAAIGQRMVFTDIDQDVSMTGERAATFPFRMRCSSFALRPSHPVHQ